VGRARCALGRHRQARGEPDRPRSGEGRPPRVRSLVRQGRDHGAGGKRRRGEGPLPRRLLPDHLRAAVQLPRALRARRGRSPLRELPHRDDAAGQAAEPDRELRPADRAHLERAAGRDPRIRQGRGDAGSADVGAPDRHGPGHREHPTPDHRRAEHARPAERGPRRGERYGSAGQRRGSVPEGGQSAARRRLGFRVRLEHRANDAEPRGRHADHEARSHLVHARGTAGDGARPERDYRFRERLVRRDGDPRQAGSATTTGRRCGRRTG
jgi:hypothetical protein